MRLAPLAATILLIAAPVLLAGCGSGYADSERSAITKMQSVITAYNQAPQSDLQTTASACSRASVDLKDQRDQLEKASPPAQYRNLATALRQAYVLAETGFTNCVSAAQTLNYPLMTQADNQIAQANASILRAHALDRQL